MSVESAAWGLIGTIVGALASIGTTWLASRSTESLQQQRAREDRAERASAFQRQTLLELQEALHDALRLVTRAHIQDREAAKRGDAWRSGRLGADLDEELRLAYRKVAILAERIADDSLRSGVKDLMAKTNAVLNAFTESESKDTLEQSYALAEEVLQSVGTALRGHFH
jgi:hypothetical protein